MGLYDEIYNDAELPAVDVPPGIVFQSRSFYYACLQKYRLTKAGRLIAGWVFDLKSCAWGPGRTGIQGTIC
jgi:hypothetical protein